MGSGHSESPGSSSISAPRIFKIFLVSGIFILFVTVLNSTLFIDDNICSALAVLPLDDSITTCSLEITSLISSFSMPKAALSFNEPKGLNNSNLAYKFTFFNPCILGSILSIGVFPINSDILLYNI
ncbi:hypothetical protein D3C76_1350490 [compost metagenome]